MQIKKIVSVIPKLIKSATKIALPTPYTKKVDMTGKITRPLISKIPYQIFFMAGVYTGAVEFANFRKMARNRSLNSHTVFVCTSPCVPVHANWTYTGTGPMIRAQVGVAQLVRAEDS